MGSKTRRPYALPQRRRQGGSTTPLGRTDRMPPDRYAERGALAQESNPNRRQAHNLSRRLQAKGPSFIEATASISQQRASHRIAKLRESRFLAALLPPKSSTHRSANRHHFAEYEIRARLVPQWPPKPVICKAVGFLPRHAVLPLKTLDLHCHRSTIPLNPIKLIGFAM